MSNHRCPDDPLGAMFDVPMVDSETGQPYQGGFWLDCLPEVAFPGISGWFAISVVITALFEASRVV